MTAPAALQDALRDRYSLERELGHGGMATVYLARDLKHGRQVAFKLLRPDLAAILGADRFLREIQLTAALQHPHILPLLDSGAAGGFLYYVMPFVEGESLRHRLGRDGQLPLDEALIIARGVASALDYAHGQGVIHRDVKPENILLYQGEPMVADFGIALAASSAGKERLTETGLSLGTPAYMSPEQASASPRLDGRSDQYSLACVIYEMLAGEPPYTGPTAQAIIAKRFSEPVPHLSTVRAVPSGLEAALTRALAKSPADRFPTVTAFTTALERAEPRPRMSRRMAALVGGAAVLAVVLLVAFLLRPRPASGPMASRQFTFTGNAHGPALSPDGKSLAYVSANQSLTVQRLDGGDPVVLVPPSRWIALPPRWTRDGTAILFGMLVDSNTNSVTWMVPSGGGSAHEVLPDIDPFDTGPDSLSAIWSRREKHQIVVVDLQSQKVLQSARIPDSLGVVLDVSWSPDQRWVAFQAELSIWTISMKGDPPRRLTSSGRQPRWSGTGDAVYFLDGPRGTTDLKRVRVDPRTGEAREVPSRVLSLPTAEEFSLGHSGILVQSQVALSSQALAISYSDGLPRRIEQTRVLTEGTGRVHSLAISDDGEQVAVSRGQGERTSIGVMPFQGGPTRGVVGSPAQEWWPSWSPDGKRLSFTRSDSTGTRLMVIDYPGGIPQRVGAVEPFKWNGAFWSQNGKWLIYKAADLRRIGLIHMGQPQESYLKIPDSLGTGYSGDDLLSPDGSQIVVSTFHRWNDWGELWLATADGRSWRRLREPFGESYPLRWTADGWLYVSNCRASFTDGGACRLEVWRLPMPAGKPEFVAPIPEGCTIPSLSRDGRRAVCKYNTRQSDLVLTTGFDPDAN